MTKTKFTEPGAPPIDHPSSADNAEQLESAQNGSALSAIGAICNHILETFNELGDVAAHAHADLTQSIQHILQTFAATDEKYRAATSRIRILKRDLMKTKANLAIVQNMKFGQSSERDSSHDLEDDLTFGSAEDEEPESEPDLTKPGRNCRKLPHDIAEEVVNIFPENRECCTCGCQMPSIGSSVSTQMKIVPEHVVMVKNVYHTCACNKSELCKENAPVVGKSPYNIMKGRTLSLGLVVEAAVQKFFEHSTNYRMARRFSMLNLNIARQTLGRNIAHLSRSLQPLADVMLTQVKAGSVAFMDETPLRIQGTKLGKCTNGTLWVVSKDEGGWNPDAQPVVYFHYAPTRSGSVAREMLAGSAIQYLQTDGYAGYTALFDGQRSNPPIVSVRCMAHARRKFVAALKTMKSPLADWVINKLKKLYKVEASIRGCPAPVREAVRKEQSLPILEDIRAKLSQARDVAQGKTSEAINYALDAFDALVCYCFDGRLEIDSNSIERCIRATAITKKNSLFAGSHDAAKVWAIFYTLIETARLNKVNPRVYLTWVVNQIENCRGEVDYSQLMPWHCPNGHYQQ